MATNITSTYLSGIFIQNGNGVPNHVSQKGSIFINKDGPTEFLSNGDGTWFNLSSATLSGTTSSGTYSPTYTLVANLSAATIYDSQYIQVGDTVTVSGKIDIDPILIATSTQIGISLPIPSNIGATEDCSGVAFASSVSGQGAAIRGDVANNRAELVYISSDLTNQSMYYTFTYKIR